MVYFLTPGVYLYFLASVSILTLVLLFTSLYPPRALEIVDTGKPIFFENSLKFINLNLLYTYLSCIFFYLLDNENVFEFYKNILLI